MKKLLHFFKKYFLTSLAIMFTLMLIHYPNDFYHGTTIQYLYDFIIKSFSMPVFFTFTGYLLLMSFLFVPFLIFSKIKYIGWIPLAIFSFFVGLEKYVFYLNGNFTPWNVAFNDTMFINFMVNPTGLKDSLDTFGSDPLFWGYLLVFPIVLFIILKMIASKLPTVEKSDISKVIYTGSLGMILLAPSFFDTGGYVPYVFRVHYTILMHTEDVLLSYAGIKREEIPFSNIIKEDTPQNILYIDDESVRGDLISINNNTEEKVMKASPYLYSIKDEIINFGNLYSLTNCSFPSNSNFLIGADLEVAKTLPNYWKISPTLYQYMKNAGYKTYYVDNVHNGLYAIFNIDDDKEIDVIVNDFKKWQKIPHAERDLRTLDEVKKILNNGEKNFIFVLKYGIHFPFKNAFTHEKALFKPFKGDSFEDQYNLYMNGIKEAVDDYWKYLVDIVGDTDTVVLYQSDHSVNITKPINKNNPEKSVFLTHCENGLSSYQEMYSIPGILYSPNKKWYKGFKNLKNGYSVKPMFSTILDFAGYDPDDYSTYYGPSFKNPVKEVYLYNFERIYKFGDKNVSNIYNNIDLDKMTHIHKLNKRRVLPNSLDNREFIIDKNTSSK